MRTLRSLAATRLARGTFAGLYGQFVQLALQLISIPVFAAHWGLAGYGVWLILFAVPSMLAIADLGLTAAGATSMTTATAQGDLVRAARIYSALRWATLASGGVIVAAIALFLLVIRPGTLGFAQAITGGRAEETSMLLVAYGMIALQNGVSLAGFRAADAFAVSGMVFQTIILVEAAIALVVVMGGGGPEAVALVYLLARIAGSIVLTLALRHYAPWLRRADWRVHWAELRLLIAPAMAAMALPAAYAVVMQGSVMAIGATGGPAAVPAFTTVRTLSRTALQFAFRLNVASMPRYTVAAAHGDEDRKAELLLINLLASAALVIPASLGILLLGLPFIQLWTGGVVAPSFGLLALMVAGMVANGSWVPVSNLILSINRHAEFTYFFLVASIVCVGLGGLLAQHYGAEGMALALLLLETVMAIWVLQLSVRLEIARRQALALAWRAMLDKVRRWRSRIADQARKEGE